MSETQFVDPSLCPLCKGSNHCKHLSETVTSDPCWCEASDIKFTETLMSNVPLDAKGNACICKACALKYQKNSKVERFDP